MLYSSTRSQFQWPELRAYHRHAIRIHTHTQTSIHTQEHTPYHIAYHTRFICSLSPCGWISKARQSRATCCQIQIHTHALDWIWTSPWNAIFNNVISTTTTTSSSLVATSSSSSSSVAASGETTTATTHIIHSTNNWNFVYNCELNEEMNV